MSRINKKCPIPIILADYKKCGRQYILHSGAKVLSPTCPSRSRSLVVAKIVVTCLILHKQDGHGDLAEDHSNLQKDPPFPKEGPLRDGLHGTG